MGYTHSRATVFFWSSFCRNLFVFLILFLFSNHFNRSINQSFPHLHFSHLVDDVIHTFPSSLFSFLLLLLLLLLLPYRLTRLKRIFELEGSSS